MMTHQGIKTILEDTLKVDVRETDCGIDEAAMTIAALIGHIINATIDIASGKRP